MEELPGQQAAVQSAEVFVGAFFLKLIINSGCFYGVERYFERGFGGMDGVVGRFDRRADFRHLIFWGCA